MPLSTVVDAATVATDHAVGCRHEATVATAKFAVVRATQLPKLS